MCGISGAIGYSQDECLKVLNHQHNRGPDNTGWILKEGVFLGHNRLSILDLSEKGNQPMTAGHYSLTYNGEIYNYRELQSYLHANDDLGSCKSGNDAYTLLQYIVRFGVEKALQDANGMYAYSLFDHQKQQIHLVVDRFGQKPLYYCHSGATFVFASSPGALLNLRDKWKINREALQSYWLLGSVMGDESMFSGIKKLTGSHHLTYYIRKNEVKVERYWQPKFQENTSGIEDLILDAINKVKVSDVPVYVFLSGGIDSTLVASQFEGGNAVHLDSPEHRYASEAAQKFNMNLRTVFSSDINVTECLKDYAYQSGEPSMAALIPYITAREVSKFAKVGISANGADELFFGYDRMSDATKQWQGIFRSTWSGFKMPFSAPPNYGIGWRQLVELDSYVQFDLNKTLDAASMCHSLEMRSPFLDHRLVEMALSIPEGKHFDARLGRKAILKRMLQQMGFSQEFLTRPKLGFSLHKEPVGLEELKTKAWRFVKENGFIECDDSKLSGRDERYLKMSALSFWVWHETWKHKL